MTCRIPYKDHFLSNRQRQLFEDSLHTVFYSHQGEYLNMKLIDGTQIISVKDSTHSIILLLFADFSQAIKKSLRDVSTTKCAIDRQLLHVQTVQNRVQLPEGRAQIKRVGSFRMAQNILGQFIPLLLCGRCGRRYC